ncbi:MAG: sugar ABC transporter permease [Alphaproteobacteria bacterium]|nr:sugar ABC transporter permease [Alphaproteobacteria bacterium]
MVIALLFIWVGFHLAGPFFTGQALFLTPRNLWNLLTQTASISIMASGMVMIIVMRQIDLSVGSVLGFIAVVMAWLQVYGLPQYFEFGSTWIWVIATAIGLILGALIGFLHGTIVAYSGIPSFIVTLSGLLFWRGAAFKVASGETIAPMDPVYALIGGGPYGAIGSFWSWVVGILACLGIVWSLHSGRAQRHKFNFPVRPMWAEATVGAILCVIVLATVWLVNIYYWPKGIIAQYVAARNIQVPPEGLFISHGFAIPVLIAGAVGLIMTFIATRAPLGRYIYAIGGNPEAAELAGINTKKITIAAYTIMGLLCAISAIIATARLNAAAIALGTTDELYVIAAAVIGGTSLSGGVGTIFGAFFGALIMQSIQTGMTLLGFDTPVLNMTLAVVLSFAVWLDYIYRRNAK